MLSESVQIHREQGRSSRMALEQPTSCAKQGDVRQTASNSACLARTVKSQRSKIAAASASVVALLMTTWLRTLTSRLSLIARHAAAASQGQGTMTSAAPGAAAGQNEDIHKLRALIAEDETNGWDKAWKEGRTPWDSADGSVRPPLRELIEDVKFPIPRTG
jgi:hypothetical protein